MNICKLNVLYVLYAVEGMYLSLLLLIDWSGRTTTYVMQTTTTAIIIERTPQRLRLLLLLLTVQVLLYCYRAGINREAACMHSVPWATINININTATATITYYVY